MDYREQKQPQAGDTVVVGMSGGVDSTMAALLLLQRGCHVIGATMTLWDNSLPVHAETVARRDSCFGPGEKEDVNACRDFCAEHDIDYHIIDLSRIYRREVLDYFTREYRSGRTPNPCIRCNRFVKFGALPQALSHLNIDYDYFCTGHYAKVVKPTHGLWDTDETPSMVGTAADAGKDQTYFLYRLPSALLEKVRFPLADMTKPQVIAAARDAGMTVADKPESQDFIDPAYREDLFADKPARSGNFVNLDGHVLGRHRGVEHYTIGQRHGLGICSDRPLYIRSIDAESNTIMLGERESLVCEGLVADDFLWPANVRPDREFTARAKVRLSAVPISVSIREHAFKSGESFIGNPYDIVFAQPQMAIALGQSVVLYENDVVIGGGIISATF